jgi:NAD(P)-dependent dehydrogenase (short-subunit alcohol dehydrogenase family)
VLITGVSSGVGRATAELMNRNDWTVVGTSRDPGAAASWALDHGIHLVQLASFSGSEIDECVQAVQRQFGRIDVLVNNAGYGVFGPLEGTSESEIEEQFRVNVLGPIYLTRSVLEGMRQAGGGTICMVSSVAGRTAAPFASLYHASKFALEGFSESLRFEAYLHGIQVKVVEPAHFRTRFIRGLRATRHPAYENAFNTYMEWVHREDEQAPPPDAIARKILELATDHSGRLRYPVKGSVILALTSVLPDALLRPLLRGGMFRRPKDPTNPTQH